MKEVLCSFVVIAGHVGALSLSRASSDTDLRQLLVEPLGPTQVRNLCGIKQAPFLPQMAQHPLMHHSGQEIGSALTRGPVILYV